jgi:hypothetical protein
MCKDCWARSALGGTAGAGSLNPFSVCGCLCPEGTWDCVSCHHVVMFGPGQGVVRAKEKPMSKREIEDFRARHAQIQGAAE